MCDQNCAETFARNVNNDMMRMFCFRTNEIERVTAQLEILKYFDQTQPAISTCIKLSSAIGNCRDDEEEGTECFSCSVDGKLEEILESFNMLKVSEEINVVKLVY